MGVFGFCGEVEGRVGRGKTPGKRREHMAGWRTCMMLPVLRLPHLPGLVLVAAAHVLHVNLPSLVRAFGRGLVPWQFSIQAYFALSKTGSCETHRRYSLGAPVSGHKTEPRPLKQCPETSNQLDDSANTVCQACVRDQVRGCQMNHVSQKGSGVDCLPPLAKELWQGLAEIPGRCHPPVSRRAGTYRNAEPTGPHGEASDASQIERS